MRLFGAQKRWKGDHWTNRAWERPPGATSRSRCVPLLRATFLKRRHEVARVLITPNSLRWPWSDLSERPTKVAPDPERPVGATHQSRSRPLARRHQKSALERLPGATPASRSALFCCRKSWFLKDLFAIYFGRFALGKTYVLNIFCSHQRQIIFYLLIYWEIHKNSLEKFISWILIVVFLCWFLIYFSTWLIWNPIWV